MNPLTVKLPAIGRQRSKRISSACKDNKKITSTSRVDAWRKKQKNDPKKALEFKKKKQEQNKRYKEKLKQQREQNANLDQYIKKAQRIWKKNSRDRKKADKQERSNSKIREKNNTKESGAHNNACDRQSAQVILKRASRVNQHLPKSPVSWTKTIIIF